MRHPKGGEGASYFHRVAYTVHVLGEVPKAVFLYLECAAGAVHSRLVLSGAYTSPATLRAAHMLLVLF